MIDTPTRPCRGVYPRVCGGTLVHAGGGLPGRGLSPRVRGNRLHTGVAMLAMRSIPACAGEPHRGRRCRALSRVYPRVCGGTALHGESPPGIRGLSPRVRGNHARNVDVPVPCGSIPACAGEPGGQLVASRASTVYPRVCGGTRWPAGGQQGVNGLSPRVRGNPKMLRQHGRDGGSIPACAGEPENAASARQGRWVYPRVCGGTWTAMSRLLRPEGLSPRVRGNRKLRRPAGMRSGSIPACAGEPASGGRLTGVITVYPRVCGGTDRMPRHQVAGMGLSPRVRGNRHRGGGGGERGSVYPRVCGGTGRPR